MKKINSKWIKELKVRTKTITLSVVKIHDLAFGREFLNMITKIMGWWNGSSSRAPA
jgi:hypothetical protein